MYCRECGIEIASESHYCSGCGVQITQHPAEPPQIAFSGSAEIINVLAKFKEMKVLIDPEIPSKKLEVVKSKYGIPNNEKVLGFVDSTMLGSAKTGIAFTGKALYWKNSSEKSDVNALSWKELIPYKDVMVAYLITVKLSKKIIIETGGASIHSEVFIDLLKQVIQKYIDIHSIDVATIPKIPDDDLVKKKRWYTSIWLWFVVAPLMLIIFADPDAPVTSLSEDRAITACYNVWDEEAYGNNHSYYDPIRVNDRWAIVTGANKYRAVVAFTSRNAKKLFACDIYLQGGEVMYRVTNNGGLLL